MKNIVWYLRTDCLRLRLRLPVVMIPWEDAIVCCKWLSRQSGLPPAYDEKTGNGQDVARSGEMNFDAAGTGQTVPRLRLPKDNPYPYNQKGIRRGETCPVGSFRPNALGLLIAQEVVCRTSRRTK
jgi:formylglycine-generating enzyme required for sulfatase activity